MLVAGLAIAVIGVCGSPPAAAEKSYNAGGAQKGIQVVTENAPVTNAEITWSNIPGARLLQLVAARNADLLLVNFSGECRLIGGTSSSEWVEMRAKITSSIPVAGYPKFLEPYDTSSPMAFCSTDLWEMQHASWADKVPRLQEDVTYTVRIQWRNNEAENTAWIDDWLMELQVSAKN